VSDRPIRPHRTRRTAITHLRSILISLTAARAVFIALGVSTGSVVSLAADATPAHADSGGRVCLFLAPENVHGFGHVGWGYRHADGGLWEFGATVDATSAWHGGGTFDHMTADFGDPQVSGGVYRSYRCRATVGGDDAAAKAAAITADAEVYDLFTSNCLTRSLEVFHAYDGSGDLASLGDGRFTAPRWYFDNDLDGFEPEQQLPAK
jgi:hypothetical protein